MANSKELKDVFNYNSLVHAISGSVVSLTHSFLDFVLQIFQNSLSKSFNYLSYLYFQGSIVAMSAFYPFDTVRSRLQLGEIKNTKNESTFQLILSLLNNEGVASLCKCLSMKFEQFAQFLIMDNVIIV